MEELSLDESGFGGTPFGKQMLRHFLFDPDYKNINHGICLHQKSVVGNTNV
jgi:hypothetical protein